MRSEGIGTPRGRSLWFVAGLGVPASSLLGQIEFAVGERWSLSSGATGVAELDVDGDGWRDIAVCERIESVTIFRNQGDGSLARLSSLYEPVSEFAAIRGGMFNSDRHSDLAWLATSFGSVHSLRIWYGRGDGLGGRHESLLLPRRGGSLVEADVTGDGRKDLVVADARGNGAMVRVFRNTGATFIPAETVALPWINNVGLVSGDIDGDGDVDLAVLSLDDEFDSMYGWKLDECQVRIMYNDGAGRFPDGDTIMLPYGGGSWGEDPHPVALRLADLDGDQDLDLVLAAMRLDNPEDIMELLPIESVEFGAAFELHPPLLIDDARAVADIAIGDLDVDGDIDLVVKANADLWVVENLGGFAFSAPVLTGLGRYGGPPMAIADLDGDGRSELIEGHDSGIDILTNVSPYDGPVLTHDPLKRSRPTMLTVSDAPPGETVHFLHSREGAGNSLGIRQLGGITLDLLDPIQVIGSAVADATGVAELTITIPPNAPLTTVVMQAVIRRGPGGVDSVKTPFRTARILP